jgi:hypothetical protein
MAVTVTRTSTLFTDLDSDGVADPGETLLVHILIQNGNGFDITNLKVYDSQSGLEITDLSTVKITPIALDDFNGAPLTIVGNTPYVVAASALLGNDIDPDGPEASLVISSFANQSHVTVTDLGNGSLQIVPETGYQGTASFDYFIKDAQNLTSVSSGHVNISISGMIWYVDSSGNAGTADGSYLKPFTDLGKLNDDGTGAAGTVGPNDGIKGDDDVDGSNDTIFVYNRGVAYTGGITLEAGQKLYGDGHELTVNGLAIGASGQTANSTVNYSTYGVTLATDNTISGLNLNGTANTAVGLQDGNGSVTTAAGTLNIDTVSIGGAGQAVDIDQGGNLNVSLTSLGTTGTASGQGVQLAGTASSGTALISGSFTAAAGSIAGEASHGFQIGGAGPSSGGTVAVNYAGTIGSSTTGSAVNIADRIAGAGNVTFSGNISQTTTTSSTAAGIALSNIAAGTIDFTGTKTIAATSGAQGAIAVSGQSGGTINFSGGAIDIDFAAGSTGSGIAVTGQTGGSVNVSTGATIDMAGTASGRGVSISSSTAGSVNFTGGGLVINTRDGAALFDSNASGSTNALNISGTGNTLATTNGGQLVEISNAATTGITLNSLTTGAAVANSAVHVNNLDGGTFTTSSITVTGTTGAAADGIRIEGGSTTNFSLGSVSVVNTGDDGIELNGANGTVSISNLNIQNTTGQGVEINGATSAVTIATGTIGNTNDPTLEGVLITGGTGAVTVGATVTKTTAGNVVEITSHNTGAISFSNTISATGTTDNGILLTNNTGGSIGFTGNVTLATGAFDALTFTNTAGTGASVTLSGGNLDIDTTGGKGINATNTTIGAGSLTISGANNSVVATTGSAVWVDGVTSNITLHDVAKNGGTADGVYIKNNGASGSFTVTGGGAGTNTGGTIQNVTGTDGTLTTGVGVYLDKAANISLSNMLIQNLGNFGIRGYEVNNFSLINSKVTTSAGFNGTSDIENEGSVFFGDYANSRNGLTGTAVFNNSTIENGYEDNLGIINTSGSLNATFTDMIVRNNQGVPPGNNGILLEADGTANIAATFLRGTFSGNRANNLAAITNGGGTMTLQIGQKDVASSGGTWSNSNTDINLQYNSTGSYTFNVEEATLSNTGAQASPLNLNMLTNSSGTMSGNIYHNTITNNVSGTGPGTRLVANSQNGATLTVNVQNNTITNNAPNIGLNLLARDGNSIVNATFQNNQITNTNATASHVLQINSGAASGDTVQVNVDIHGNAFSQNVTAENAGSFDIRLARVTTTTGRIEGYSGSATDGTAIGNYLASLNTGNNGAANSAPANGVSTGISTTGTGWSGTPAVTMPAAPISLIATPAPPASTGDAAIDAKPLAGVPPVDYTPERLARDHSGSGPHAARMMSADSAGSPLDGFAPASAAPQLPAASVQAAAQAPAVQTPAVQTPAVQAPAAQAPAAQAPAASPAPAQSAADSAAAPAPAVPASVVNDDGRISQGELDLLVSAAIDRWAAAGATAEQVATLRAVKITVADIMGMQIGGATAGDPGRQRRGRLWLVRRFDSGRRFGILGQRLAPPCHGDRRGRRPGRPAHRPDARARPPDRARGRLSGRRFQRPHVRLHGRRRAAPADFRRRGEGHRPRAGQRSLYPLAGRRRRNPPGRQVRRHPVPGDGHLLFQPGDRAAVEYRDRQGRQHPRHDQQHQRDRHRHDDARRPRLCRHQQQRHLRCRRRQERGHPHPVRRHQQQRRAGHRYRRPAADDGHRDPRRRDGRLQLRQPVCGQLHRSGGRLELHRRRSSGRHARRVRRPRSRQQHRQ